MDAHHLTFLFIRLKNKFLEVLTALCSLYVLWYIWQTTPIASLVIVLLSTICALVHVHRVLEVLQNMEEYDDEEGSFVIMFTPEDEEDDEKK